MAQSVFGKSLFLTLSWNEPERSFLIDAMIAWQRRMGDVNEHLAVCREVNLPSGEV